MDNLLKQTLKKLPLIEKFKHLYYRFEQRLWFKPLLACLFSVLVVFSASYFGHHLPKELTLDIQIDSVEKLLTIMANSLLAVATFAVSSMVAAYASASSVASPRSFSLVVADDKSKNALSTFIGVFIFSVIGLTAIKNEYFSKGGVFILFCFTLLLFLIVVLVFVRWVDAIARLGRLGETIERVKTKAHLHMTQKTICGTPKPASLNNTYYVSIKTQEYGYVQKVFSEQLQALAECHDCFIEVCVHSGDLISPNTEIIRLYRMNANLTDIDEENVRACIKIGASRQFDDNPFFGMEVLSEIGNKALSPGINDTGTAKQVIHELIGLLYKRDAIIQAPQDDTVGCDRVALPARSAEEFLEVSFTDTILFASGNLLVMKDLVTSLKALQTYTKDAELQQAIDKTLMMIKKRTDINLALVDDKSRLEVAMR